MGSRPFCGDWRLRLVSSVTHEERREEGRSLPRKKVGLISPFRGISLSTEGSLLAENVTFSNSRSEEWLKKNSRWQNLTLSS
jgi:hypothetical protein